MNWPGCEGHCGLPHGTRRIKRLYAECHHATAQCETPLQLVPMPSGSRGGSCRSCRTLGIRPTLAWTVLLSVYPCAYLYRCIHMRIIVYIYTLTCVCVRLDVCPCVYVDEFTFKYVRLYINICIHTYIYIFIYICQGTQMHICTYTCIHVDTYIHVQAKLPTYACTYLPT